MSTMTRTAGPRVRSRGAHARSRGAQAIETAAFAFVVLAVGIVIALPRPAPEADLTRPVRVRTGQTLWELAVRHPLPGASTAETVEEIRRVNELEDSRLVAGSVVLVPAAESPTSRSAKR